MKRQYFCTSCNAVLNPNVKIILRASARDRQGLILLSPQPGNYQVIGDDALKLVRGERTTFSCPVCHADLRSGAAENLAEIGFRDLGGGEGRVNFSRVAGEHATWVITDERVRAYGEDAVAYDSVNFFGEGKKRG